MSAAPLSEFADLLVRHRHRLGLTQEELAELAGLSTRGVSDLERGARRAPHRNTVNRLADALRLDPLGRTAFVAAARPRRAVEPDRSAGDGARVLNLPREVPPIVGRERELLALADLLSRPDHRLVTLTGTGGSGKTRLAVAAATARAAAGDVVVCWVALGTVMDPALLPTVIARALGVRDITDQTLVAALSERPHLLVLDNYEQLLPATAPVTALLDQCPDLRILMTSRAALQVRGEHEVQVMPLPVPGREVLDDPDALYGWAVTEIFARRAMAVRPEFRLTDANIGDVARIAATLDGLPLAIELAAARSRLLSPAAILRRLDRRLPLLTGGPADAPARHRSLRDAISWSYDLLDTTAQRVFRTLSIFSGGFTLPDATTVYGRFGEAATEIELLDRLTILADRSLVTHETQPDGEPRFGMLQTIREYGLEMLAAAGDLEMSHRVHAETMAALTARVEPRLVGADQRTWYDVLEREQANLRQGLTWAVTHDGVMAVTMAGQLARFWDHHGHLSEGRRWFDTVLALPAAASSPLRGKLYWGLGTLCLVAGDYDGAEAAFTAGHAAASRVDDPYHAGFALNGLGSVAHCREHPGDAVALQERALAMMRTTGDRDGTAAILCNLGVGELMLGNVDRSIDRCEESLAIYRDLGSHLGMTNALGHLGRALVEAGRVADAIPLLREGLALGRDLGNTWYILTCLETLAAAAAHLGAWRHAIQLFAAVEATCRSGEAVLAPFDQRVNARYLAMARRAVHEDAYRSAWAEGAGLDLSEAVALGLGPFPGA